MKNESTDQSEEPTYRSGTAARLTGIPVDTLRMWERRYQVVGPQVSARGHRRYAAEDIERLAMIKSLVDDGHAIGTIAHLPAAALRDMRTELAALPGAAQMRARKSSRLRVAIVGEGLVARAAGAGSSFEGLHVVGSCADREQAASALRGVTADLLVIEMPVLREDAVEFVDALTGVVGARRAMISYRFGNEVAVRGLRRRGHVVARAPIDLAEIASLGADLPGAPEPSPRPLLAAPSAPRFDERTLANLAQISTTVRCECPRHVVDLLQSLQAFERYSGECESRNTADAELHRHLGRVAGSARALFEDALVRVAQAEGIPLPLAIA